MRTSDTAPISATPLSGMSSAAIAPSVAPIPLADRLKAVGLFALAGTIGVGSVLLVRALWHPGEEPLLPLAEDSRDTREPSLRDRVSVVTPRAAVSPPESSPQSRTPRSRPSPQGPSLHISQGFGSTPTRANPASEDESPDEPTPEKPATSPTAENPAAENPAIEEPTAEEPTIGSMAEKPTAEKPTAEKPATAKPGSATIAPTPVRVQRSEFPIATIAALLEPPQPDAGTVAIAPPPPIPGTLAAPPASGTPLGTPPDNLPDNLPDNPPNNPPNNPPDKPASPVPATHPPPAAPGIPIAAIAQPPSRKDGVYVERITITGNTRFSQRELAGVVQQTIGAKPDGAKPDGAKPDGAKPNGSIDPTFVNRRLSPAELVQASEAITKLYTGRGYINSGAYIPAEVLTGATPEIRVVEGRLEAINVAVQPPRFLWLARPLSPNYVRRRLERGIQAPLQIDQLVDAVKLLEQDPLINSISTELAPGTTTGRSILNVKVRQASPVSASVSVDNSRSPTVGRLQQQVTLSHANLLGLGDRLQASFSRTEGSRAWNVGYVLPINPRNGTLSFSYSNSRGEVIEKPFRDLDINSRSQTYEIALRQPIVQTSTQTLALTLRGTHYSNRGVFLETFNDGVALPFPAQGADPNGQTRVTALRFGQEWVKRGDRDVVSLQSEFSFGIAALNATVLDAPPDGRFFAWQGRGFWVHSFAPDTLFALKGQVQFADRPLVPVEQISIGGIDTVRGYRTSTLLSDSGWFASAEAYLPVLRVPKWRGVLQVIPFLDIGQGWNRGLDQPSPNRLLTTGLGLQWKVGDKFRARVDWGIPLINTTTETGRSLRESLFFSVTFTP